MATERDVTTLDFESKTAEELVEFALTTWGDGLRIACGFTLEDVVILHLATRKGARPHVFCVDTGRHFEQTFQAADLVRKALGIDVQWVFPDPKKLVPLLMRDGASPMATNEPARRRCCDARRFDPLTRALNGAAGWISGARRAHTTARTKLPKVSIDEEHGWIAKVAPLADWKWADVIKYVTENRLPVNPLFRQGYSSVGCAPCTRPITAGEPERAGRWAFEPAESRERGLHMSGRF